MMMKTATTTAPTTQSAAAAAQAARSTLELLSNTAMLKTVMDSNQQKSSTSPVATPTGGASAVVASPSTTVAKVVSRETLVQTPVEHIQKPVQVVVEKSSLSPELTSPHQTSTLSPFATLTAGSSPGSTGHRATLTPASSYASLLAPSSVTGTPVALATSTTSPAAASFALPSLALAHLSPALQMQMAMMASANTMYGSGPSSAFRKPYMPGTAGSAGPPVTVTASPSMDYNTSRDASPTQGEQRAASYEALLQENLRLKQMASRKDETIASLQAKADGLEKQIVELRQLPTGKISHIPIE